MTVSSPPPRLVRAFRADRGDDRARLDLVLLRHLADRPEISWGSSR
ncbi:MAG TPA: hypothetical protein VLT87_22185 [Thermoanaerobaculia bacterium]|nr:hypothetical protein [Thermoanaerobaculia bacterium]